MGKIMTKNYYKLMVTKQINFEQIVQAENETEALVLFDEEDLFDRDSKIISDITIKEYSCEFDTPEFFN